MRGLCPQHGACGDEPPTHTRRGEGGAVSIRRVNHGKGHSYIDTDTGLKIPGVTTITGNGLPKPALLNWAGDATAEYAIDMWDNLAELPLSERLKRIKGGRYEKRDVAANKGTQIHKLAERLIAGERVVIPDGLQGYVQACVAFLDDFDVRQVYVEAVVYSQTRHHVGTADLIADVMLPDMPDYDHIPRQEDGYSRGLFDWKGLALSTPIPTPDGWTTMGALAVGDRVFDRFGQPCAVTGKSKVHLLPCRRMKFDDGSEVICDEDHRWLVRSGRRAEWWDVATATEIAVSLSNRGQHQHRVPVAGALDLPDTDLPIDPYVLGVWLGDGTASGGKISGVDGEIFDLIAARGYIVGANHNRRTPKCPTRNVFGLRTQLRLAGLLGHKAIPDRYLRASARQRLDLLRGLMDTDGTVNRTRHQAVFGSTDKALSYGVRELVHSLGERCSIAEVHGRGFGRPVTSWRVSWRPQTHNPFALSRKATAVSLSPRLTAQRRTIVSVDPTLTVPTQCITVDSPDETYLCGEQMIPTHNTGRSGIFGEIALQLAPYRHSEFLVVPGSDEVVDMPDVDFTAGIHLRPDGYSLVPLVTDESIYRDFLYVREVARIVDGLRDLVGEPIVPATASRYMLAKADEVAS